MLIVIFIKVDRNLVELNNYLTFPHFINSHTGSSRLYNISYTYNGSITYLEHVVMNMSVESIGSNSRRGDISIELTSPSRTQSTLLKFRSSIDDFRNGYSSWPFMSVMFWGENPVGRWLLSIRTANNRTIANFSNLQLQFYGTSLRAASVARIPSRCHSNCVRGCAAEGSKFCDACANLRNAYTLQCIDRCPPRYTERNGYCFDHTRPDPVCNSKLPSLFRGDLNDSL